MIFSFNVFETEEGYLAELSAYEQTLNDTTILISKTFKTESEAEDFKVAWSTLLNIG